MGGIAMIKELIKQRFSKSLNTYQDSAIVQKQMAEKISENLSGLTFENILELGCGTGFVTKRIAANCKFSSYDAVDIVNGCESYIKQISNKINFINTDIEEYSTEKKYNLIISNASLQWLEDFESFVKKIKNNLADNGLFVFTLFGKENFKELKTITGKSLRYYSNEELAEIFNEFNLKISEDIITLNFQTPKDVLYHIKNTGVNSINQEHWTKSDLKQFEDDYLKLNNGKITLTYHPIYIELRK
ncbi:MAG: malonyl-ACP O-methyltransferase BioC [Candidatus Gastranaerophilales bacterium]|nr:malonyl-ACP O-methyltransferase BioC [Candidatus Gastranaerophilales bacterium]